MPYEVKPAGDKFEVVNKDSGKVMGSHASRAKAEAQMRALYANEPEASKNFSGYISVVGNATTISGNLTTGDTTTGTFISGKDGTVIKPEASKRSKMDKLKIGEIHRHAAHIMEHAGSMMAEEAETAAEDAAETPEDEAQGKSLNLSYVKSLGVDVPLAVKYISLDTIKGYTFLWGSEKLTDVELEYFTPQTDFWDEKLGKNARPLTWDHAQDPDFKAHPVIGQINDWGDDEIGRWYTAKLDRAHKYRKAIDALIEAGKLGTSSDSAPQYVQRVKTGKSTWLKEWAWFASALTDTPAEPRMIGSLEVLKSLGIALPDTPTAWEWNKQRLRLSQLLF